MILLLLLSPTSLLQTNNVDGSAKYIVPKPIAIHIVYIIQTSKLLHHIALLPNNNKFLLILSTEKTIISTLSNPYCAGTEQISLPAWLLAEFL